MIGFLGSMLFGVQIPIITKLERFREKPIDKFRKAITKFDKQEKEEGIYFLLLRRTSTRIGMIIMTPKNPHVVI